MNNISALTFLYNEADKIEKCLQSIRPFVNEIIVFDLESTDGTADIARKYTTEVYSVPHLLCGDAYKLELINKAKYDWIFWFYADEFWPASTGEIFKKLTAQNTYDIYGFMRHEYLDEIRVGYGGKDGKTIFFGSPGSPNYQMRLFNMNSGVYFTELVHAEYHHNDKSKLKICCMPPEYYLEHKKTSKDQEFDNWRLYVMYKQLIWKYRHTKIEPYKTYVDSYRKIVSDSEAKNITGDRKIHLSEEFWWDWMKYADIKRLTLEEFEKIVGMPYKLFIETRNNDRESTFIVGDIRDEIFDKMKVDVKK